jgi:hypothetical protein
MEVGLIVKWGKLVPGREQQAIDLFTEATEFFTEYVDKKVISSFEPFFYWTSDKDQEVGFFVLKGPQEKIFELIENERFLWLQEKAMYTVEHFTFDLLTVGEGITKQLARSAKVRVELGIS